MSNNNINNKPESKNANSRNSKGNEVIRKSSLLENNATTQRASLVARKSIACKCLLEQQFKLPESFQMKIVALENDLNMKNINGEKLLELVDLYSVNFFSITI